MKLLSIIALLTFCFSVSQPCAASDRKREKNRKAVLSAGKGYYKDIFMNGGINLSSRRQIPVTRYLGLTLEYFATAPTSKMTKQDTILQAKVFCGHESDTNGPLLYPDGEPRFRMIYVNGGSAARHGRSLTVNGRATIQRYVASGGSYVGSCAGAFVSSKGAISSKDLSIAHVDSYLNLWPGTTKSTRMSNSRTAMAVEPGCGLLRFYSFGGDMVVDSVYHNNGCFIYDGENGIVPHGTEPLMRYIFNNTEKYKIDGEVSTWAYKTNEQSGRVVVTGSHPEAVTKGERLDYMAAMVLYAMEGNGVIEPKGELVIGQEREMNKRTEDNDPAYTRIGDKQYHHFKVDIPKRCKRAIIQLKGYKGKTDFDLSLRAKHGEMAYHDNTTHQVVSLGCSKELIINNPKSGEWYISVFCETTVTATDGKYGTEYTGRTDVLNGVPYKILIKCDE